MVSFFSNISLSHQSVEAGLEEERLQRERQETQWVSEAEARAQVLRVKAELKAQERQAVQLESSCRAVDRSLGQSGKKLQVRRACLQVDFTLNSATAWCSDKGDHPSVKMHLSICPSAWC